MQKLIEKANLLVEALPYIKMFHGKTIVIKYGGAAMTDPGLKEQFAQDIVLMKYVGMNPVIVHGGGPQINQMMEKLGMKPRFLNGVRITDIATLDIVEMVLGGTINKEIVSLISRHGGRAVGLTGKDGNLITARKYKGGKNGEDVVDLGLVGEVEKIDPTLIHNLDQSHFIPVIAPIGVGKDGATYNINADWVAGEIAGALKAEKLLILTDVAGILDAKGTLCSTLSRKEVHQLIKKGVIKSGMLPKVESCLTALDQSVGKAHIIDGRVPHAILLEIFTDQGVGTEIYQ
ncbi:MAG TPA: acetylglutamate kinase [Nitrospiria bacterium]|nr:acetylglutamate kinase [Nitrospiria bacterium]